MAGGSCARMDVLRTTFPSLSELVVRPEYEFYARFLDDLRPALRTRSAGTRGLETTELESLAEILAAFMRTCGLEFRDGEHEIQVSAHKPTFSASPLHPPRDVATGRMESSSARPEDRECARQAGDVGSQIR